MTFVLSPLLAHLESIDPEQIMVARENLSGGSPRGATVNIRYRPALPHTHTEAHVLRHSTLMAWELVGPYGFEWPEGFDHEVHETFWRGYRAVLARRLHKWDQLLSNARPAAYPNLRHSSAKLKRYVRKGVPREHRKQVWMVLSGAAAMQIEQRGLYQSLLQQSRRPDLVETIQIDVPRTFPDNVYFQGGGQQQKSLFNILVAYAHFNQGVGYCQGLNFIAGLLLLATEDEESSFWLLRALLERLLPDYYGRHMTGLLTDIEVLAELIRQAPLPLCSMTLVGMIKRTLRTCDKSCNFARF
ncbi:hypothetical protein HPB51_007570 [Rhipicephalus microplus]|uniref:Rab-GAP TBC domain-containing protein n=1 Tax=Rhipicephalus microplus TaxID=6941 RepID=A0A9J6D4G2_RHIMP|nr:hypothetical protein HPB51_007570 [Rhipicephalus microplus]